MAFVAWHISPPHITITIRTQKGDEACDDKETGSVRVHVYVTWKRLVSLVLKGR